MEVKVNPGFHCHWLGLLLLIAGCPSAASEAQDQKLSSGVTMTNENQSAYQQGMYFHQRLEFDSAMVHYRRYQKELINHHADQAGIRDVDKRIHECESGKKLVAEPRKFTVTNLGRQINSPQEDYGPVLSEDERMLVFTSRRGTGNLNVQKSADGKYFEDIFSARQADSIWSQAVNMGQPINTLFHDSDLALTADGRKLFLYSDANEGDIMISDLQNGKWSQPKSLPSPINTPYHESSISTDGKRYFVASERPGGMGGSDIWVIEKDHFGQWTSTNLGGSVNTAWDEDGPFIDYDAKTLYFSSKGHNTMGGSDIFRSVWADSQWLDAENLGFPINTPGNDSYFVSTRDGRRAYYSSVRAGGFGEEDIYVIKLPKELTRDTIERAPSKPGIPLKELKAPETGNVNATLVIYFDFGSATLSGPAKRQLKSYMNKLMDTSILIQIEGHTDHVSSEDFNKSLSLSRTQSVQRYLMDGGISGERMWLKGWGSKRPAVSNDHEKTGQALNRRVEIRVISN